MAGVLSELQKDEIFRYFAFWASVMVVKMMVLVLLTVRQRFRKQVYRSPEDSIFFGKNAKHVSDDPDVERPRRCLLNDLENIIPWFICTSFYLTTSPPAQLATNLIRAFGVSRIVHTLVYGFGQVPQPLRGIAFAVGFGINLYQACTAIAFYYA